MTDWDADELEARAERAGEELQAIQDALGRGHERAARVRFPRGFLSQAHVHRARLDFVVDTALKHNISYTMIMRDVHRWLLMRTDLYGIPKEMVIKESIVLAAAIVESATREAVSGKKNTYKKRVQKLRERDVLTAEIAGELDWLWDTRNNAHLMLISGVEFGRYKIADFKRATRALDAFFDSMNAA